MRRTAYVFIIILLVFVFGTNACTEKTNELSGQHYKLIDSLVLDEKIITGRLLDSLCELHFDSNVSVAVDSIMEVRIREIKAIMESDN